MGNGRSYRIISAKRSIVQKISIQQNRRQLHEIQRKKQRSEKYDKTRNKYALGRSLANYV